MHTEISCRHGHVSDATRSYIERKCEHIVTLFERVTEIEVIVDFEGGEENGRVLVEIQVDAEHKHDFVAKETGEDVGHTFDATLHKVEQQVRKYKEKIQDHRRDTPMGGPAVPLHTPDEEE